MTTLVAIRHLEIEGRVFTHGAELPPGLFPQKTVDKLIDQGRVQVSEPAERRSLYRLFPAFSGSKEQERITKEELREYALRE